jgi:CRP/FNR family cyclic AMP-dependent transcriptional regulator
MVDAQLLDLLSHVHFLFDVGEDELHALAHTLDKLEFAPGEEIILQGARADAIFFITSGSVDVMTGQSGKPETLLANLRAGDTIGEMEIVSPQPWAAAAIAVQPTIAYRWSKPSIAEFVKTHPSTLRRLRFSAQSTKLSRRLRFNWLGGDEVVHAVVRKHSALFYQALTLPVSLLAAAALLALWGIFRESTLTIWIAGGIVLMCLGLGLWRWIDWRNDYYILTNRRVVWLEKVVGIYDNRLEAPLHMVLSVSVSTDMLGRTLGYGDVIIRTYTGRVTFRNICDPHAMAALIEEYWRRSRSQKEEADHEDLRSMVRQRLEPDPAPETLEAVQAQEELETADIPTPSAGIGAFNFKVRFEDKDVITYRKHWAVLTRAISAPSVVVLLLAGVIGARLVGMIEFLTLGSFLLIACMGMIGVALWWLYRYLDWANDLYQITPSQIVDVYKKPLAREERKVAPLENILGTEVDRKGIFGILLNYGDVIANVGIEQFTFHGVYDPLSVQQDIVHAQEAFIHSIQERERQQRQDEMIELINIYHDEVASRKKRSSGKQETQHDGT